MVGPTDHDLEPKDDQTIPDRPRVAASRECEVGAVSERRPAVRRMASCSVLLQGCCRSGGTVGTVAEAWNKERVTIHRWVPAMWEHRHPSMLNCTMCSYGHPSTFTRCAGEQLAARTSCTSCTSCNLSRRCFSEWQFQFSAVHEHNPAASVGILRSS